MKIFISVLYFMALIIPVPEAVAETSDAPMAVIDSVDEEDGNHIVAAVLPAAIRIPIGNAFLQIPAATSIEGSALMSGPDRCIHWMAATLPDGTVYGVEAVPACTGREPAPGLAVQVRLLAATIPVQGEKPSSPASSGAPAAIR